MADLTEGQERALRSDLGLNEMAGHQGHTTMKQIASGDVNPDDLKQAAEDAETQAQESEAQAQKEADEARQQDLENQQSAAAEQTGTTDSGNTDMESHTVEQLRDMAREREITGYSSMNKQELIDALAAK